MSCPCFSLVFYSVSTQEDAELESGNHAKVMHKIRAQDYLFDIISYSDICNITALLCVLVCPDFVQLYWNSTGLKVHRHW